MRAVGIGLLGVGLLASLWADSPCQAAGPSSLGIAVVQTTVGHPPGPPGPGRYWRHPPVPRPPCVVLPPPPPPPPPPRRVYYVYPPAVYYYPYPFYYYSYYDYYAPHGTLYYSTPRAGIVIHW